MDIKYLGHASFFIKSKDGGRLITDPFDSSMVGLRFPKLEAEIVTVSHHHGDHDKVAQVGGEPLVIDMPGEFEKKGIKVTGHLSYHDKKSGVERGENILYKIESDGLSILHCGDLGVVLEDSFVDTLGEVDILLVPTGGFYTINSEEAVELVKRIEPSVIIPMHYNHSKLNQSSFGKLEGVDEFIKKMNLSVTRGVQKLTVKPEELGEEMKVVVMDISN